MTAAAGGGRENRASLRQSSADRAGWLTRLRRDALRALAAGPLYRHTLVGRVPADLRLRINQRWPGEAERGTAIAGGEIELAGELVRNPSPRWAPPSAGIEWLTAWHAFGWMCDLVAAGGTGREAARELVESWIAENPGGSGLAWRSDILATRAFAWIVYFDEIVGRDKEDELRRMMLASLVAQLRHLARTASWEAAGAGRLRSLKGLIAGVVVLGGSEARLAKLLRALERELSVQILPDGGHLSRSPSLQLQVLQDLIDVRAVLRAAHIDIPGGLKGAIERMAPMLRFFRHGDRRLALFNDSLEEDGVLIDLVLTRSESKGRAPLHAPDTGFDRLQASKTLVLIDTGRPPRRGFDDRAHAGTLSLELSHERERIIVNCGAYRGPRANWWRVARASAAHSVLVVADTNSLEIKADGTLGRGPASVARERAEHEGQQWMSGTHDGYRERFGLIYTRELFLAADGEDLRGEDRLTGLPGSAFAVRFHLHPAVQASLLRDAGAVLLRLPSGMVWRLRAAGAEISLGESIYLGSGEARKTQQVVLSGTVPAGGATVRWAIRREPKGAFGQQPAEDRVAEDQGIAEQPAGNG
ncbi:MAG: heparinase II/III family protein [Alphaproteobacteria bacterium]|nr:heparinase II/III family protein [Alphaproteobacteria bacterium]